MRHTIIIISLLSLLLGPASLVFAQNVSRDYWRLCPADRQLPIRPIYSDEVKEPGSTEIRADASRFESDGLTYFSGDVEIIKSERSVFSQLATYDEDTGQFNIEGDAHIWDGGLIWQGERALFDLDADVTRFESGNYWLTSGRGRGKADLIKHDSNAKITRLSDVDFTTCALGQPDWKFSAERIKLDHEAGRGSATHALLKVRDVPIFYLPYVNFPLNNERKTGILFPSVGTSNESGFDIRIPFYLNLAPNHDVTLTPRWLAERGVMLGGEYRYLQESFEGQFGFEYMPTDQLDNGNERSLISFDHLQRFDGNRGIVDVRIENVSDAQYFEDFGRSLSITSQRFLDRRVDIRHYSRNVVFYGLVQSYQVVDDTLAPGTSPYERLPQLTAFTRFPLRHMKFHPAMLAQATYFDQDSRVSGGRLDFEPAISYPFLKSYARVVPRLALRHTEYFLEDQGDLENRESRTLPVFSLDSQLFAERRLGIFGSQVLQTFEPRAMYLYIPKDGQDDIPVFDSGLFDVNFKSLFYHNRFSGRDRIGDANRLSLAVTNRFLSLDSGRELFRASFGQIYYFQDREITLPGREKDTDSLSELIAEVAATIGPDWSARATLQWDPEKNDTEKSAISIRYQPGDGTIVNASYRQRQAVTDIEQTDVSFRWPVNDSVSLIGRWNYSLQTQETLEGVAGFEYESCCWGLRVVGRRFLRNTEGEFDNAVFFQVEFKGLGGYGGSTASFLKRSIPGYESYF